MKIMVDAYLDNNLGDDLMIKLIAKHFSMHHFYLYSDNPAMINTFADTANITLRATALQKKDLKAIDVYLSLGGSIFQLLNWKYYYFRLKKVLLLKQLKRDKKKVVTLGSNLGPFGSKIGIKIAELELRQNDLITVRDQASYQLIQSFRGIDNCHLAEDIVYNLHDDLAEKRSGLGISAYRSIKENENNEENYRALAKISDAYTQRTGKKVYLFAFDSGNEDDIAAANAICRLCKHKDQVVVVPYLGNHQAFLQAFKSCERMIAIRFHAAVLSDYYHIPFLPVAYSNKMENLTADRKHTGSSLKLAELKPGLNLDPLLKQIISGQGLYQNFESERQSARTHMIELGKLLHGQELKS